MYEAQVQFLGHEDSWEKEMATLSSILAWRILWTEEPGRPQSTGSPRVGFDWSNLAHIHAINLWNSDQYKFVQPLWKQFGMSCKVEHTHMWGLSDKFSSTLRNSWDFPGGPDIKNPPSNAGDIGSIPGWGTKIPHAIGQLSPRATAREVCTAQQRACVCNIDPAQPR